MFVVVVEFKVRAGREAGFMAAVLKQARDSLAKEPGCLRFDVCRDPDDPTAVVLYEVYRTSECFDRHLASEHFAAFATGVKDQVQTKVVRRLVLAQGA